MIFVTVGTHASPFDRLIRAADQYAANSDEPMTIQTGSSAYAPRHAASFAFTDADAMQRHYEGARVIVSHGGAGSLIIALKTHARCLVVPRLAAFGEHWDDHQLELATALDGAGLARWVQSIDQLPGLISTALSEPRSRHESTVELVSYLRTRLAAIEALRAT